MAELKAWTQRQNKGSEPAPYSINFDYHGPDESLERRCGWTQIVNMRNSGAPMHMSVSDNIVVQFAGYLLAAGGKDVEADLMHLSSSTKLKWKSFPSHRMGCGLVGYYRSCTIDGVERTTFSTAIIHENAQNTDPDIMRIVENECAMLAYLLNKFRFDNSFISEQAKSCAVYPDVMRLPEFNWRDLPPGKYRIKGQLNTGPVRYVLEHSEGSNKIQLFLHVVEPTAAGGESLLGKSVIATVMKFAEGDAALFAVEACNT